MEIFFREGIDWQKVRLPYHGIGRRFLWIESYELHISFVSQVRLKKAGSFLKLEGLKLKHLY